MTTLIPSTAPRKYNLNLVGVVNHVSTPLQAIPYQGQAASAFKTIVEVLIDRFRFQTHFHVPKKKHGDYRRQLQRLDHQCAEQCALILRDTVLAHVAAGCLTQFTLVTNERRTEIRFTQLEGTHRHSLRIDLCHAEPF